MDRDSSSDTPVRLVIELAGEVEDDPRLNNLDDFVCLQINTCRSVRVFDASNARSRTARWVQCKQQIKARSAYLVWLDASLGNPESCLELGLRMYTGCGASKDRAGALEWWRRISDPADPNSVKSASASLKAKALACLAVAYLDKSFLPQKKGPTLLHLVNLYRAAQLANASLSLGLVTPIAVKIANNIEKIGLRRQADCRFEEVDTSYFEALEFLWKARDARDEEKKRMRQTRDAKVSQAPNLYICAAEGCGIEGTSRSGLLQCSGKCPPDDKPSYCSKECQKADWKCHRLVCTGEAKAELIVATRSPEPVDNTIGGNLRNDGRELTIEVPAPEFPGGRLLLSSTVLSASFLKQWRDLAEAEEEEAKSKSISL